MSNSNRVPITVAAAVSAVLLGVGFPVQTLAEPPVSGSVACYHLDSDVVDPCGMHDGTNHGADFGIGSKGQGALFDGVASYIDSNYAPILQADSSISISFYAYLPADIPDPAVRLMGLEVSNGQEISFQSTLDGKILVYFRDDSGTGVSAESTASLFDGACHHFVGVRNATTGTVELYVDGAIESSVTDPTGIINANNPHSLFLGANNHTGGIGPVFHGMLDEVFIFDRPLNMEEIQPLAGDYDDCNGNGIPDGCDFLSGSSDDANANGVPDECEQDVIACYHLDGNATDPCGGNDGTNHGAWYSCGIKGLAAEFDGTSYIDSNFAPILQPDDSLSIALWAYLPDGPPDPTNRLFGFEVSHHQEISLQSAGDGRVIFYVRDDGNRDTSAPSISPVFDGAWHHFVCIRNGPSDKVELYIDGVLQAAAPDDTQIINAAGPRSFYWGGNNHASGPISLYIGLLDEARVYDRPLSLAEIRALAGEFDDCNGNGAPDILDINLGASEDCNDNCIPDECDVPPIGSGPDCNENGIPDECEPDCDDDGIPDDCDDDRDGDGVLNDVDVCPDTPFCEALSDGRPRLDMNGDCEVNALDIEIIVQELLAGCSTCP